MLYLRSTLWRFPVSLKSENRSLGSSRSTMPANGSSTEQISSFWYTTQQNWTLDPKLKLSLINWKAVNTKPVFFSTKLIGSNPKNSFEFKAHSSGIFPHSCLQRSHLQYTLRPCGLNHTKLVHRRVSCKLKRKRFWRICAQLSTSVLKIKSPVLVALR